MVMVSQLADNLYCFMDIAGEDLMSTPDAFVRNYGDMAVVAFEPDNPAEDILLYVVDDGFYFNLKGDYEDGNEIVECYSYVFGTR